MGVPRHLGGAKELYNPWARSSCESDLRKAVPDHSHSICVTTVGGNQLPLKMQAEDTIRSVKEKVWQISGLHVSQQHLLYDGVELKDEQQLSSFPRRSLFSLLATAPRQLRIYVQGTCTGTL